jgi:NADH dehydrogenase FAD-containing subunit
MAALPWSKGVLHLPVAQFAIQGGQHAACGIERQRAGKHLQPDRHVQRPGTR